MMNELVQDLAKTPAFSSLPAVEIQKLISLGREKSIHKGNFLCMQDDLWPYMVYLRRGQSALGNAFHERTRACAVLH